MVGYYRVGVALAWWGQQRHPIDCRSRISRRPSRQFAKIVSYYLVLKKSSALGRSCRYFIEIIISSVACGTLTARRDNRACSVLLVLFIPLLLLRFNTVVVRVRVRGSYASPSRSVCRLVESVEIDTPSFVRRALALVNHVLVYR